MKKKTPDSVKEGVGGKRGGLNPNRQLSAEKNQVKSPRERKVSRKEVLAYFRVQGNS